MLNLNLCSQDCFNCIKEYKKKFNLQKGDKFDIYCNGIPKNYISKALEQTLTPEEAETAITVLDPVQWAAKTLDWHCLDPDGEIWKRKDYNEWLGWHEQHPDEDILGHSRYHRPYQALMLRCKSQQKVMRIGRQAGKSEVICVAILYYAITKPNKSEDNGFNVLVIAPFQSQIDLIFKRLQELIDRSKSLQNSILRSVKAPNYTIKFHNHSMIKGFTAGSQGGGNANSVRGQHADLLCFDESDMLNSGDIDSSLSVLTNSSDALLMMSSTPTGKREKFYESCNSPFFKEFHYPAQANPLWNKKLEERFKSQLTELGYKHEILAQFGEQEEGVFQVQYILAAKEKYQYGELKYNKDWIYTVGVDWNDTKIGSTICVVGYNPTVNHFFVVDRVIVSKDGWTQTAACQKIIDINRIWQPVAIYVDHGFGHMQVETLRKFGYDSLASKQDPNIDNLTRQMKTIDSRLKEIVHAYEFGGKITVHDLFTKQPIDKAAKPFLVENAVRRFENKLISFPEKDDILESQLNSYIIDHITPSGVPTYKASDKATGDHTLDALMLALIGFTLEKTPIGKPTHETKIAFSGYFGQVLNPQKNTSGLSLLNPEVAEKKNNHAPELVRSKTFETKSLLQQFDRMPATNLREKSDMKIWSWPGFLRDDPPPKKKILSPNKIQPPRRKNI